MLRSVFVTNVTSIFGSVQLFVNQTHTHLDIFDGPRCVFIPLVMFNDHEMMNKDLNQQLVKLLAVDFCVDAWDVPALLGTNQFAETSQEEEPKKSSRYQVLSLMET